MCQVRSKVLERAGQSGDQERRKEGGILEFGTEVIILPMGV
jgi:hypothetical protein